MEDFEMNEEQKSSNNPEENTFFKKLENILKEQKSKKLNDGLKIKKLLLHEMNFILIGQIGSGKSTLINALLANNYEGNNSESNSSLNAANTLT